MKSIMLTCTDAGVPITYRVVPMCSHGEVHWFGVLDGADPLALLIAGYAAAAPTGGVYTNEGNTSNNRNLVLTLARIASAEGQGADVGYCSELASMALERAGWVRT